ncbi:MAG: DUF1801 domain-containing protein [Bauldia sp.]|nr:DUF1801 domain-containing protein [Bauldia sp.]
MTAARQRIAFCGAIAEARRDVAVRQAAVSERSGVRRRPGATADGLEATMTNYSAKDVEEYIAAAHEASRSHLREVRRAIRSAVPDAEEGLSWGKPYYRHHGMLAGFDAFKNHISIEIWTDELGAKDRETLERTGYKTGQRTFQVRYDQKVPIAVIERLVKAQAAKNEAKAVK